MKREWLGWRRKLIRLFFRAWILAVEVNVQRSVSIWFQVTSIPKRVAVGRIRHSEALQIVDRQRPKLVDWRERTLRKVENVLIASLPVRPDGRYPRACHFFAFEFPGQYRAKESWPAQE